VAESPKDYPAVVLVHNKDLTNDKDKNGVKQRIEAFTRRCVVGAACGWGC